MRRYLFCATLAVTIAACTTPAFASFPGANGRLVFEVPNRNGANLFTVLPDGSGRTRLTDLRGFETEAEYSPDGSRIAFAYARSEDAPLEIWVMNADGTGRRRLTRNRAFSVAPTWSPDGTKIVYATDKDGPAPESEDDPPPPAHLYEINADGSGNRRMVGGRNSSTDPAFSPDGSTIVFARLRTGRTLRAFDASLMTVRADGGGLRRLTPAGGDDELNPNWSPDGRLIAYERTRRFDTRQSDIAVMNADGSAKRRLTRSRVFDTNPVWAPDGSRIAFTSDRDNRNLSRERLGRGFELYSMGPDGSDVLRLTNNRRPEIFPNWQPLP